MEIKPYTDTDSKKMQVSRMFDNISGKYDLLNTVLSLGIDRSWRRKAIAMLQGGKKIDTVLDIATGTADLAIECAKQLQPQKIIGIDIAEKMLEIGRGKIKNKELTATIELQAGDSENLAFPDNNFDAVTVAFGVRNFENLDKGLSEMYRVLNTGGTAIILEFSHIKIFPLKQLYNFYFQSILPFIGRITSRDTRAYTYLYESVKAFPDGDDFVKILQKTGFKSVQCKSLTLGICSIYRATK